MLANVCRECTYSESRQVLARVHARMSCATTTTAPLRSWLLPTSSRPIRCPAPTTRRGRFQGHCAVPAAVASAQPRLSSCHRVPSHAGRPQHAADLETRLPYRGLVSSTVECVLSHSQCPPTVAKTHLVLFQVRLPCQQSRLLIKIDTHAVGPALRTRWDGRAAAWPDAKRRQFSSQGRINEHTVRVAR